MPRSFESGEHSFDQIQLVRSKIKIKPIFSVVEGNLDGVNSQEHRSLSLAVVEYVVLSMMCF